MLLAAIVLDLCRCSSLVKQYRPLPFRLPESWVRGGNSSPLQFPRRLNNEAASFYRLQRVHSGELPLSDEDTDEKRGQYCAFM